MASVHNLILLDGAGVALCRSESLSLCPHTLFVVHPVLTVRER